MNLDTPLGDEIDPRVLRTSMASVTQGRTFGVPETPRTAVGELPQDRHTQRPQQPIQHTVSAAERGMQAWAERQLARAAAEVQAAYQMSPRCKPAEIAAAYGLGPTQDPFRLHSFSADTAYERVTEWRREHRRHRSYDDTRLGHDALAQVLGRSGKQLQRYYDANLLPDARDDSGLVSREWASALAGIISDLHLSNVKRMSDHQSRLLSSRAFEIHATLEENQ